MELIDITFGEMDLLVWKAVAHCGLVDPDHQVFRKVLGTLGLKNVCQVFSFLSAKFKEVEGSSAEVRGSSVEVRGSSRKFKEVQGSSAKVHVS